ncbi:MAG: NAD-dependent epimerase/dehydratase family protein [Nanoarchaeota archaeon]|nr:NAD-dependent epimerase/dehydratase family protein [Nanoarchaeota archaeon]
MIKNKQILLTGGSGFIGTAIASRLVDHNKIIVYDNNFRNSLKDSMIAKHDNLKVIKGDVLDFNAVKKAAQDCKIIIHLAAIAGVDTVLKMPVMTMKVNIIGTYNILEAAISETKVERFVDFSTSEVFGTYAYKVKEGDVTTLGAVGEARWTYAVSKLATEHMAHNYYKQYGIPVTSIRPFNIYGPGQVGEGAIHTFILRALENKNLEIHGDGSQIRTWCYIDDIVDSILLCLENKEAIGHVFNIGNPRSVCTTYDLARKVVTLSKSRSKLSFIPWNFTDVELRIPNIDKSKEILGYKPKVELEAGLLRTIDWYKKRIR